MNHYYYSGLSVRSEFPIPEWEAFEVSAPRAESEVIIRRVDRLPHPSDLPGTKRLGEGICRHAAPDHVCYVFPDAGRFCIRDGREILVAPEPGAGVREIRLFLLGSAWGALCYQRGLLVLHAGVVKVGDGAAAFFGPTDSGKSALAARLASEGYSLVSDDLCRFDVGDLEPYGRPGSDTQQTDGPSRFLEGSKANSASPSLEVPGPYRRAFVWPAAPRLKLWRDSLEALGRTSKGLERDHFREDKFHVPSTGEKLRDPLPLHAIYLLEWGELDLTRLTGLTALRRLVTASAYRPDLLEPMGLVAGTWQLCANLIQSAPVRLLSRPRDWNRMQAVIERLVEDWR